MASEDKRQAYIDGATDQKAIDDELCKSGEASDGYHTFNELYDYRMLYNAAFFNKLACYDNQAGGSWKVEYDVQEDINQIQSFGILKTEYALFQNFQLDQTRTVVTWSEDVDLPSDTLYEFGKSVY